MSPDRPIRLLLVAPGPKARHNLRVALEPAGVEVVGEAGDLRTALLAAVRLHPDAVVVAAPAADDGGEWALSAILRTTPPAPVLLTPLESWVGEGAAGPEAGRLVEVLRQAWTAGASSEGDGLALLAHDILTPAGSVVAIADMLLRYWDRFEEAERRQAVGTISGLGRELASLVDRMVRCAATDPGAIVGVREPADVGPVLLEAVEMVRPQAGEDRFEVSVEPGLPPVRIDRSAIVEALTNFLSNAAKYSPEGSPVRVAARASGREVHVTVSDRGPGIDPRHRSLLFQKFSRLPGTEEPGHGLGLFLSRTIVEAHGGHVFVDSAPGEGATFGMALPAVLRRPRRRSVPHRSTGLPARP